MHTHRRCALYSLPRYACAMSRLQAQRWRLYSPASARGAPPGEEQAFPLIDGQGQVRAMVLTLARPADWSAMARLWQGVQDELGLPAPGIAVNGIDGYQLWFSVAQPITTAQAHRFLMQLRMRYWADIPDERVSLMPSAHGPDPSACRHADPVPAPTLTPGQWSAFVTRDLAPVFNDSPWLDIPPNPDGQADLLSSLRSIGHAELLALLSAAAPTPPPGPSSPGGAASALPLQSDPRQFLLRVMNDPTVDLALRIEAAKALLP